MDMREGLYRNFAHGEVLNLGENPVAQLGKACSRMREMT